MTSRFVAMAAIALTAAVASGCGRTNHYCRDVAPRTDMAVGEALRFDAITPFFTGQIRTVEWTDLRAAHARTHDGRFEELGNLVVIYPYSGTLETRVAERFGRGETDAGTGYVRPNRETLLRIQTLSNELRRDYCSTETPRNRCMNSIGRRAFGIDAANTEACQSIQTQAAADCVATVVRRSVATVDTAEILACAAYYHPNHAECLDYVGRLAFGVNPATVASCGNIWRTNDVRCVARAVRNSITSIPSEIIDSCGSSR